jgi:hypothetical protein
MLRPVGGEKVLTDSMCLILAKGFVCGKLDSMLDTEDFHDWNCRTLSGDTVTQVKGTVIDGLSKTHGFDVRVNKKVEATQKGSSVDE